MTIAEPATNPEKRFQRRNGSRDTYSNGSNRYYCYVARNLLTNLKGGPCASGATVIGLGYDDRGNVSNKNGQLYDFDFGNRLREATGKETYRYDGLGRRVQTTGADQRRRLWQYSQGGQLMFGLTETTTQTTHQYIYLAGSLIAVVDRNWVTQAINSIKFQHTDALGTPVAETDTAGTVVQRSEYDPYGRLNNRPLTDGPGYTGHYQDAATGLTYMQQRYYDPKIGGGRFLSVDPVTATSVGGNFNRYWYANNNPYKYTDPDGREVACNGKTCTIQCDFGKNCAGDFAKYGAIRVLNDFLTVSSMIVRPFIQTNESSEDDAGTKPSILDDKARDHILDGDENGGGGHRAGTGTPGKSEFPGEWSDDKIEGEISDVATDPETKWSDPDSRGYVVGSGTRDGVDIKVVYDTEKGRVVTGYPTNTDRNPKDEQ